MPETFLRAKEVARRTGQSIRSVKRKGASGEDGFPTSIRLSDRITVWVQSEVDRWVRDQIRLHRGPNGAGAAPDDAPDEAAEPEPALARPYARAGTGRRSRRRAHSGGDDAA